MSKGKLYVQEVTQRSREAARTEVLDSIEWELERSSFDEGLNGILGEFKDAIGVATFDADNPYYSY